MQLLMDETEVLQQLLLPLPVKDVIGHLEGLRFLQSQKQCPDDKVHPYILFLLPWQ